MHVAIEEERERNRRRLYREVASAKEAYVRTEKNPPLCSYEIERGKQINRQTGYSIQRKEKEKKQ